MPDYFEAFGMPRHLEIDTKDLEKKFYALSRRLHPDLFARKSPKEQEDALEVSAVLNDAYRVLRDPIARAMYVMKLEGFEIGEQGTKDVPPELLEEVFELNMALEDESARDEVLAARGRFEGMRDEIDAGMQGQFAEWDRTHERSVLEAIRGQLNRRKYITNLIARTDKAHVSD
ncbi:MAG TPA: Fe-S protein assembly co-chaperone HscB [Bryobacteraceae bacterium]|nr:Fe-S protein assembly co-chaperone HscB [Bryobacteraceae bacterium]